jgi:hypothetical protein
MMKWCCTCEVLFKNYNNKTLYLISAGRNSKTHFAWDRLVNELNRKINGYNATAEDNFAKISDQFNGWVKTYDGTQLNDEFYCQFFKTDRRIKSSKYRFQFQPGVERYTIDDFRLYGKETEVDQLPNDITALKRIVIDEKESISTLKSQVTLIEKQYRDLRQSMTTMEQENRELKQSTFKMEQEEDELFESLHGHANSVDKLKLISILAKSKIEPYDTYKTLWKRTALKVHPDKRGCSAHRARFFGKLIQAFNNLPKPNELK